MIVAQTPPRVLGRYALYDKIAHGGMATVHLGRLLGPVGFARTVAIKRLHAQFAGDPEFVSMFLDEARLVARISHPNVVPTLDVVATEGELFIVMEYVHGESLARLARAAQRRGTRIPIEMCVTLMASVLHGLHAAHEARSERGEPLEIVHRDVSPQNILLGVDGAARVLDFGVAKSLVRLQTTRQGQLKGKLSYMAPEQIHGRVTRSTDIYAAAIVLWELLAGRRLFDGESEAQIFDRVLKGCQTPPSAIAPVPHAVDAVTMRGLAPNPAARFSTAREMARALEDSMHPIASSKIGEWVESMMQEQLSERRERIAAIEISSATLAATGPPTELEPNTLHPPIPVVVVPAAEDSLPTQLSSGSVSAPGRASAVPWKRRSLRIAAGALVAVATASVLAVAWTRLGSRSSPSEVSATSPPVADTARPTDPVAKAALAASAPIPSPVSSATEARPSNASPRPTPSAEPPAAVASAWPPPPPPPPARRASAAPPAPTVNTSGPSRCNPPWTIDARGVRSFKKECL